MPPPHPPQLSSKDMGFLEERIKQAGKNRPVIRKFDSALPAPALSGGGGGGVHVRGGGNRVVPFPANAYPPDHCKGDGGGGRDNNNSNNSAAAAEAIDVNSLLHRLVGCGLWLLWWRWMRRKGVDDV